MTPIICKNDITDILKRIEDFVNNGGIIKGMKLVDQSSNQVVVLIDSQSISDEKAQIWWSGYQAAIGG